MLCSGVLIGVCGCSLIPKSSFKNIKRISKESLKARLEDPSIVILDVRRPQDWNKSGIKIKGAIQENPHKFNDWYYRYPKTKTIVLY
jgi:rhodanese-related sulfurtransferase